MTDQQELEQRVAWLERKLRRLLWNVIMLTAFGLGALAYSVFKDGLGNSGAFAVAFAVFLLVCWVLEPQAT